MLLRQMESFVQIVHYSSFSKAAEAMYMTTPGVIRQIDTLEEYLGFRLFERSNKGVTLTQGGRVFYEGATRQIDEIGKLVLRARESAGVADAKLIIGICVPNLLLTEICSNFQIGADKAIRFEFKQVLSTQMMDDLLDRRIDMYLQQGDVSPRRGVRQDTLACLLPRVLINANHPLAANASVCFEDMVDLPLILTPPGQSPYFDRLRKFISENYPLIQIETYEDAFSTYAAIEMNRAFTLTATFYGLNNPLLCLLPIQINRDDMEVKISLMRRDEDNKIIDRMSLVASDTILGRIKSTDVF